MANHFGTWKTDDWRPLAEAQRGATPDAVEFAVRELGFRPDGKQAEVLRSEAKQAILNCTRQWGKSTVAGVKALHRAYTQKDALVVVASPGERQSAEFLRKVCQLARGLKIPIQGDGDNGISLAMPNGSRIVGLPGTEATIRGFSAVSLMLIDEAARVPDEVYKALRPMLAVGGGDLWLMSTPCGKRGFFYENWTHGGPEWARFTVPATECGRIPREFLEQEREQMGNLWFQQEYLCEFVDNGDAVFDRGLVEKALCDVEPLLL